VTSPALILVQPLQSLPSLLALGDVRRHTGAVARASADPGTLTAMLELDPLAALRGLRIARAAMHGPGTRPASLAELVACLGTAATARLFDVPPVEPARTRRIRELWLQTVARACAAEHLARATGCAPPATAYLNALLADLDGWMEQLGLHHNGQLSTWRGADLNRHWGLGLELRSQAALDAADPVDAVRRQPDLLLPAAAALARIAGFPGPRPDGPAPAPITHAAGPAAAVRAMVEARFARLRVPVSTEPGAGEGLTLLPGPRSEALDPTLIDRLLGCRSAISARALETIAVAAALRYLDYDRAFVVSWNPDLRRVWLRAKADRTRLPLVRRPVRPTEREADALQAAGAARGPRFLIRGGASDGLCGHLAADRAIVLPLDAERSKSRFLVLDRAFSARPIDPAEDLAGVHELAGFLTLLFDNLELRLRRRRAQRNATLDALTGLANRGVGIFSLERAIAAAKRSRAPLCVMMLDMDDFKLLNDRHGHLVGDQALRAAASVLRRTVRSSDVVCRYGGEEFLAILPQTEPDEAMILATRLFTAVADAGREAGLPLTVSIGLASLRPTDDLDSLVARADGALYASKSRGRNRFSADTE
jgi:diguanylate cyclase (GGDEF)-like protein